jgi:hypothetical protein
VKHVGAPLDEAVLGEVIAVHCELLQARPPQHWASVVHVPPLGWHVLVLNVHIPSLHTRSVEQSLS